MANPQGMMGGIGQLSELKSRLGFLIGALIIFRMGTYIPVPGVNPTALVQLMEQQKGTIIDMFNMFSGGALGRFSLFALGVMPYISASIIVQLLSSTMPALKELKKEGESGRRKITQYTRYFTVILASFQSMGVAMALQKQGAVAGIPVITHTGVGFVFTAMVSLTAGTMFLMWLGEQITERGIGNGISMLIFAGIVAGLPQAIGGTLELATNGQLNPLTVLFLLVVAIGVTWFVVFIERGQRRLKVHYAQRQGRQAYQQQGSHLPLKINMSGVIPAIFASSLILFPGTIANWFGENESLRWLQKFSTMMSPGQPLYVMLYALLIVVFAFFYTAITFDSKETADNLKRSGAFLPGIRPGKHTAEYIDKVLSRLTAFGSMYLVFVCLLPDILILAWNVPFYFGGTSLLIIVVVIMDFMAQVQAHLVSHQYDGLMKKANLKNQGKTGRIRR